MDHDWMEPEEHYRGILETRDAMHRQSLVPRLRDARYVGQELMRNEAADEIERLRNEIKNNEIEVSEVIARWQHRVGEMKHQEDLDREEIARLRNKVADWKDRYESAKRDHEAEIKDIDDYYRTGLMEPWELSKCT